MKQRTMIDFETVCLRLSIKGLIVPVRLWILSRAYYQSFFSTLFLMNLKLNT